MTAAKCQSFACKDFVVWMKICIYGHDVLTSLEAGKANAAAGGFARAESLLREAREKAQGFVKPGELMSLIPLATSEQALGYFYQTRRRTAEARACYQELVALWQKLGDPNEYVARQRSAAERLLVSAR